MLCPLFQIRVDRRALLPATAAVLALFVLSSCALQMSETEAFPGQVFSEGENNMLNYPEDPARTEYTGERLGHQSKSGMIAASKSDDPVLPIPVYLDSGDIMLRQVDQTGAVAGGSARIDPAPLTSGDIELDELEVAGINLAPIPLAPGYSAPKPDLSSRIEKKTVENTKVQPVSQKWRLGVFLASYRSKAVARNGWRKLRQQFGGDLDGLGSDILKVDLGPDKGGVYYRLFAVPMANENSAAALCRTLESGGQFCRTARSGGRIKW